MRTRTFVFVQKCVICLFVCLQDFCCTNTNVRVRTQMCDLFVCLFAGFFCTNTNVRVRTEFHICLFVCMGIRNCLLVWLIFLKRGKRTLCLPKPVFLATNSYFYPKNANISEIFRLRRFFPNFFLPAALLRQFFWPAALLPQKNFATAPLSDGVLPLNVFACGAVTPIFFRVRRFFPNTFLRGAFTPVFFCLRRS